MAYEDFTTYDETDEGNNITVISSKVSWVDLDGNETSHVSDSKGVNHFDGDFEHLVEIQIANPTGRGFNTGMWGLANVQDDLKAIEDAGGDCVSVGFYHDIDPIQARLRLRVFENGVENRAEYYGSFSTTYYLTIARDDDGGVNNTGQYTVEIRTGSHTGTLVDTLTIDCAAGEQNDFQYIYSFQSYDANLGNRELDGFTQNLDLQEEAPPVVGGAMTLNTGYWGAPI